VKLLRNARTGHGPVRRTLTIAGAVAALAAAPVLFPAPALAADGAYSVPSGQDIDSFYKIRVGKPMWFYGDQPRAAAQALLSLLDSANVDGLNPADYDTAAIKKALRKASGGNSREIRKADEMLSRAFAEYALDLRRDGKDVLKYVDPSLPRAPSPLRLLQLAAGSQSLEMYVANMEWMNPDYVRLRRALASGNFEDERQRDLLKINLDRARALPVSAPRYIVVNTATQRLYMYDADKLSDSMKVVVGQERADRKTPMMAGYLRYASLNPYWNVPPDLVWDDVGKYVDQYGLGYLKSRGYQVLSDWGDNPSVVDPSTVDWEAVKNGDIEIRVRQLPGPRNVLGDVKYTFSNPFGVYLHDTTARELLDKDVRTYSGGCIRLEDATRLGKWLYGHELHASSDAPDIKVPLQRPVPVYVMYMTAIPSGSSVTFLDDVYGWDAQRLAEMGHASGTLAAR
jgi:murein L,D-transpeptidase YcbB/YkuD